MDDGDKFKYSRLQHNSTLVCLELFSVSLQLDDPCHKISEAFKKHPGLPGVLIFDQQSFDSMISRQRFLEIMNLPYSKDLFSQRKIKKLAKRFEAEPLTFSADTYIGAAVEASLERSPREMTEPVVVEKNGIYFILGSYELFRAHAHIFSETVKTLQAEIIHSNLLREKLDQARREAEDLARLDGLTGIPNRRHMDEYLTQEWQRAMRYTSDLSVILIDIDHFKSFNDIYGHQTGDEVLVKVARCLKGQTHRPADMVSRYGGEEFLVVLPDTPIQGAQALAEKMRQAVMNMSIINSGSSVEGLLSISCGVACVTEHKKQPFDQLVSDADKALYQAKSQGRNKVVLMQHPVPATE
ncbi:MAG: GGDEF domain-containing protein [Desulfuromonadales bacterium]|nr:GGDEF domain-containing protein [Desulfuromonadales bacterium]